MKSYEKLLLIVSCVAVAISIAAPLVTYMWLDPEVRHYNDPPSLAVNFRDLTSDPLADKILVIKNDGHRRVDHLLITLFAASSYPQEIAEQVRVNPPIALETRTMDHDLYISPNRPLAPGETLEFSLPPDMFWVTVYSEYGQTFALTDPAMAGEEYPE